MVQTRSQTKAIASIAENTLIKVDPPLPHPKVWTKEHHWLAIGGQCGQSCPCCRAEAYLKRWDPDGHWGACDMCMPRSSESGAGNGEVEVESGEMESGEETDGDQSTPNQGTCPGCADDFQPNQQAHIGPNGCLGDW